MTELFNNVVKIASIFLSNHTEVVAKQFIITSKLLAIRPYEARLVNIYYELPTTCSNDLIENHDDKGTVSFYTHGKLLVFQTTM